MQGFSLKAPVNFDDIHASVVQESDFDEISDEDLAKIIKDERTEILERQVAIAVARKRVEERQTEE